MAGSDELDDAYPEDLIHGEGRIRALRAKLHGLRVTGADLNYRGSVTLDPEHCRAAGIYPLEFVEIWNKSSGARLATYVIHGEPGSRCCVLNGAAARLCAVGDEVIIAASWAATPAMLTRHRPVVLMFDPANEVVETLEYRVTEADGGHRFEMRSRGTRIGRSPRSTRPTGSRQKRKGK